MDRAQTDPQTLNGKGAGSSKRPDSTASTSTTSTTSSTLSHPEPSPSMPSHARSKTVSNVDLLGQGKRLSLQFPIQPAAGSDPSTARPRSRPQSWQSNVLPQDGSSPSEINILAVLAAQERYVLELKEELNKAEVDLKTLKKHYAQHEASKRRDDVRKVAQLQPLKTTLIDIEPDQPEEDGSNQWMQRDMERRKALLSNTKDSKRKVFSGSRHLRTLSLLSPDRINPPSFPQPLDIQDEETIEQQPLPLARSSTSSDLPRSIAEDVENERFDLAGLPHIQREQLIRAGTQMAKDFKTGLFTFMEDLRQATVGEEATNGAEGYAAPTTTKDTAAKNTRKPSDARPPLSRATSSKKSVQRPGSIGDDFWKENGLSEPKTTSMTKKTHSIKTVQTPQKQTRKPADEEEDWDNWDTPNDDAYTEKTADSSDESDAPTSPVSGPGSSRTSTQSMHYHAKRHDSKASSLTNASIASQDDNASRDNKRNSIPWPDLVKLSPNNLKRTASHLMKEWEKQLTPPPDSRGSSHPHADYLGPSGSPAALP